MTTIAAPGAAARTRRVPLRRVAWVSWRQHRATLAGAVALFAVLGGYLLYMGLEIHHAYAAVAACHPASSATCGQSAALYNFNQNYYGTQQGSVVSSGIDAQTVPFLLLAVPILLGVFAGAPVLARELDSGTFRFAWTQACGRVRWALTRLTLLAVTLTVLAYAFSQLFGWYFSPFLAEGKTSKFPMQLFGNLGVDFAAWTLLAFAVAAFLGVLIRRAIPAMAVALASCAVLDVVTMMALRPHYLTPLRAAGANPPGGATSWLLGQSLGGPGHATQVWTYLPGSDFWRLQLIEGGWLLALSALLIAATLWLVRHRAA